MSNKQECGQKMEVYDRIVGYYRPRQCANLGKQEEIGMRKTFDIEKSIKTAEKIEKEKSLFSVS